MTKKNAVGTVSFIFVAIVLSKLLGQAREMVIAFMYGDSISASAYFAASQIPVNFFDMILGSAISSAFIPVYNKFTEKEGEKRADQFATRFLNAIILATTALCIVGILLAPWLIEIMVPDLEEGGQKLAAQLLRIMFPMVIFIGMAFTLVGILQSKGEFRIPAIMSMVSSGVTILYLVTLNGKFGIHGLAAALFLGWFLQFLILALPACRRGFHYKISDGVRDEGLRMVVRLALPVLLGTWVQPINATVNTALASGLDNGSGVAALNYANRLYVIAASVFAVSITNYIFPQLSRLAVAGQKREWTATLATSLKTVLFLVVPVAVVFLLQSEEIIRLIYQRGEFTEGAVQSTSTALFFYSVGMVGYAVQEILNKAFYSKGESKIPTVAAVMAMVVNFVLGVWLSKKMGIGGLALAASSAAVISAVFSFIMICKKADLEAFRGFGREFLKVIIMGAVCAVVVYVLRLFCLDWIGVQTLLERLLTLALPAAAGLGIYVAAAFVLRAEAARQAVAIIKEKLNKGGEVGE